MKSNDMSESYQKGNLKAIMHFATSLGEQSKLADVNKKEQILLFLNSKIKSREQDPEKKWITTWNDYLWRPKLFF